MTSTSLPGFVDLQDDFMPNLQRTLHQELHKELQHLRGQVRQDMHQELNELRTDLRTTGTRYSGSGGRADSRLPSQSSPSPQPQQLSTQLQQHCSSQALTKERAPARKCSRSATRKSSRSATGNPIWIGGLTLRYGLAAEVNKSKTEEDNDDDSIGSASLPIIHITSNMSSKSQGVAPVKSTKSQESKVMRFELPPRSKSKSVEGDITGINIVPASPSPIPMSQPCSIPMSGNLSANVSNYGESQSMVVPVPSGFSNRQKWGASWQDNDELDECWALPTIQSAPNTSTQGTEDAPLGPGDDDAPRTLFSRCSRRCGAIRNKCRVIVGNAYFNLASAALILFNSFTMGWQADHMARNLHEQNLPVFAYLEIVFAVLFTLELSMRLVAFGHRFFICNDWKWNLLDFTVVVMQLVESLLLALKAGDQLTSMSMLRLLRFLRLLRGIRITRLMKYLVDLRTVIVSVMSAFKPLCSNLALIGLIIYIAGIFFTDSATTVRAESSVAQAELLGMCDSLGMTMFRLFMAVTGGMDWENFAVPIMNHISPAMGFVFVGYIVFMTLAIMNIVTGIFVDAATQRSRKEKDDFMINNLKEAFEKLDLNSNGSISWGEFQHHLRDRRLLAFFKDIDLDPTQAADLFTLLDTENSGEININEFLNGCLNMRGPARALDMQLLKRELCEFLRGDAEPAPFVEELIAPSENQELFHPQFEMQQPQEDTPKMGVSVAAAAATANHLATQNVPQPS